MMTKAVCKSCGAESDDIASSMFYGCSECGAKLFSIVKEEKVIEHIEPDEPVKMDGQVSIKVKRTGEYQINLSALANRRGKNSPIMVEDEEGVVRVVFDMDADKDENEGSSD